VLGLSAAAIAVALAPTSRSSPPSTSRSRDIEVISTTRWAARPQPRGASATDAA